MDEGRACLVAAAALAALVLALALVVLHRRCGAAEGFQDQVLRQWVGRAAYGATAGDLNPQGSAIVCQEMAADWKHHAPSCKMAWYALYGPGLPDEVIPHLLLSNPAPPDGVDFAEETELQAPKLPRSGVADYTVAVHLRLKEAVSNLNVLHYGKDRSESVPSLRAMTSMAAKTYLQFTHGDEVVTIQDAALSDPTKPFHLAVVVSGGTRVSAYIDGELVHTRQVPQARALAWADTDGTARTLRARLKTDRQERGASMRDLFVIPRALTSKEVAMIADLSWDTMYERLMAERASHAETRAHLRKTAGELEDERNAAPGTKHAETKQRYEDERDARPGTKHAVTKQQLADERAAHVATRERMAAEARQMRAELTGQLANLRGEMDRAQQSCRSRIAELESRLASCAPPPPPPPPPPSAAPAPSYTPPPPPPPTVSEAKTGSFIFGLENGTSVGYEMSPGERLTYAAILQRGRGRPVSLSHSSRWGGYLTFDTTGSSQWSNALNRSTGRFELAWSSLQPFGVMQWNPR